MLAGVLDARSPVAVRRLLVGRCHGSRQCSGESMKFDAVRSADRLEDAGEARPESSQYVAVHTVVGPESRLLALDQPRFPKNAQVVRDRWLLDRDGGLEVAYTYTPLIARQHVQELQADRMREQ